MASVKLNEVTDLTVPIFFGSNSVNIIIRKTALNIL